MKKVSTAARKQSRNFSQQKLTIGLDLGDRSSCYCVLDETGSIVLEQRVATTPKCGWEGWRQWQLGQRENLVQRKPKRIHLTPTGLLMEGDYTCNLSVTSVAGHYANNPHSNGQNPHWPDLNEQFNRNTVADEPRGRQLLESRS